MTTDAYLAFLGLGVVMVVLDGQILYHSGKRYLADVDDSPTSSNSMARLIAVLFHLVMFGVLALLSVLNLGFGGDGLRSVIGNLGVLLLVVAAGHAVTMAVLTHLRDTKMVEENLASRPPPPRTRNTELQRGPVVAPVPGQPGRDPRMSPTIENQSL